MRLPALPATCSDLITGQKGATEGEGELFPGTHLAFSSYLLRHRPKEYPIAFDRHGFAAWGEGLSAQYGSGFGKSLRNKCGPWPSVPTSNPSNKRQLYYGTALGKRRILPRDVIVVDAVAAHADGVRSLRASGPLFLAENVPFKCLSLDQK